MTRLLPRLGFLCSVFVSLGVSLSLGACAAKTGDEDVASASNAVERNDPAPTGIKVRVIAGNLSSGTRQSWDPGHGIRMLKGLAADIAVLQEFNYGSNTDADYKEFLSAAFEPSFSYTVESAGQIPNGVVSRYPIVEHGVWQDPQVSNRSFVWARIDVPGDKDLWAVSLHLLTSGTQKRQAEAAALVQNIKTVVPEGDYLVIGGDFNTGSRTESCLQTLGRVTRTTGPWPVDSRNNGGTSRTRSKPYDWVIASPNLDSREVPVAIGGIAFEHGLVFDSREFPELDAVVPAEPADSNASNMQHMAVVRDFALPN
jgi:endonuclease/exonuclease/phosphatase family metal-dependent hydrolase